MKILLILFLLLSNVLAVDLECHQEGHKIHCSWEKAEHVWLAIGKWVLSPLDPRISEESGVMKAVIDIEFFKTLSTADFNLRWVGSATLVWDEVPGAMWHMVYCTDREGETWNYSPSIGKETTYTKKNLPMDRAPYTFEVFAVLLDEEDDRVTNYKKPVSFTLTSPPIPNKPNNFVDKL